MAEYGLLVDAPAGRFRVYASGRQLAATLACDCWDRLPGVAGPTLLPHGRKDRTAPFGGAGGVVRQSIHAAVSSARRTDHSSEVMA